MDVCACVSHGQINIGMSTIEALSELFKIPLNMSLTSSMKWKRNSKYKNVQLDQRVITHRFWHDERLFIFSIPQFLFYILKESLLKSRAVKFLL